MKNKNKFDSPWKDIIDHYFHEFMDLCLPYVAKEIDWSEPHVCLDKELSQIAKEAALGERYVDKLIKVKCLDGKITWILVHIEVQKQPRSNHAERMFIYRYRLFDKYKKPVLSVAILIDNNPKWRPNIYKQELFGTRLEMEYLVIKLLDYRQQELSN